MRKHLLLLLLLVALQYCNAQQAPLKFDHFNVKEGLPEPLTNFIKQDDLGYIWIGTQNGLVRYDGYKPKVYRFNMGKNATEKNSCLITMIEDQNKNLWFTTVSNGLFRFNRATDDFTQFKYPQETKKRETYGQYLSFADSNGNLWGYTANFNGFIYQVFKFDQKTKKFKYFEQKLPGASYMIISQGVSTGVPYALFRSTTGGEKIWLGSNDGLSLYNPKDDSFHPFTDIKDAAKQKGVYKIYEAPAEPGILWLNVLYHGAKEYRIERFDTRNKTFRDYDHTMLPGTTAANDTINNVYEDKKKGLWFTTNNGLMSFNRNTKTFKNYLATDTDKSVTKNRITQIVEATNGTFWLTSGKGLLNFNPQDNSFRRYVNDPDDPTSLAWNVINHLLVDNSGTLWAGTYFRGADKLNTLRSAFKVYRTKNIKEIDQAKLFAYKGEAWFTSLYGIFKFKPGFDQFTRVYQVQNTDGLLSSLYVSKNGTIYFSNTHGLQVYDPVTHKRQSYASIPADTTTLHSNLISFIMEDHTGMIWIGSRDKGVCTFDPVTHVFKRYPFVQNDGAQQSGGKLDDARVHKIYEDREGTIWTGTDQGGLSRFDRKTGKFRSYLFDGDRHVKIVPAILEDRGGRLWIGTYLFGLYEFDRQTGHYTRHITEDNGLLFNSTLGLKQDKDGFLWVISQRGLTRVDPKDLATKNYPMPNLIPGADMQYYIDGTILVNDHMVLPLVNGLASFDPRDLGGNPYPPIVHIEKVGYSNPASETDSITTRFLVDTNKLELPYNQNRVTFNYVALHFTDPTQNKYNYRLKGYDNHWINAGTLRSATYTNLSPGTYTFYVRAANSDGVWNNKGDSFTIVIHSPWWERWWAWIIYILLFGSAIYAFAAFRSRKLIHDKHILEHKVQVRTEEVLQQKEEIEAQRDNLERAFGDLKTAQNQLIQSEKMASLGELTAGIAHEIQNPLNFVNNFSEVSVELIDEMEHELTEGDKDEAIAIAESIKENLEKIQHHGKRAEQIVKGMLQHSRASTAEKEPTNINTLADEFLKLSYHGLRAKDKTFNAELITHFDDTLPKVNVVQQDIGRVLLNLFNNAFYAVNQKSKTVGSDYKPKIEVSSMLISPPSGGRGAVLTVRDNGTGVPESIKDKIMQPFFTTKPTGEGTGLGLSLSYDIVVKGHGGTINIDTKENEYTEFTITLPI